MASTAIAPRPGLWGRITRALSFLVSPSEPDHGAHYSGDIPADPSYDPRSAISAYAAFPWVYAGVSSMAADLAGLPLVLTRGKGDNADTISDHPVLDLLEMPGTTRTGEEFRRQWFVDLKTTGNAYALITGTARQPLALTRLHPAHVRVVPHPVSGRRGYEFNPDGAPRYYEAADVLHVRYPSWEDDPAGEYGMGSTRPLHDTLTAEQRSLKLTAELAENGRPDVVISPASDQTMLSEAQRRELVRRYDEQRRGKAGGALVIGGGVKVDFLNLTPRELEFTQQRETSRQEVMAVIGQVPTRMGLPTANYAQSREMSLTYWQGLQAESRLIDAQLTRLARRWDPQLRISHDFSGVDAMQESRTSRLERVTSHIFNGVPAAVAYRLEGFDGIAAKLESAPAPAPADDEERAAPLALVAWMRGYEVPQTEEQRDAEWRGFIEAIHGPIEKDLARTMAVFLRGQSNRIASRLGEVLADDQRSAPDYMKRNVEQIVAQILSLPEEASRLLMAMRGPLSRALRRAFTAALDTLQRAGLDGVAGIRWNPERPELVKLVDEFVANIGQTTAEAVRQIIERGISEGLSVNAMQAQLQEAAAFSPTRALRVARTETTRAVNAGSLAAYQDAAVETGATIRKQWLTARDEAVRESHRQLDGQTVDVGEQFKGLSGNASAPGGFGIASEDINCRCTTIAVVEALAEEAG